MTCGICNLPSGTPCLEVALLGQKDVQCVGSDLCQELAGSDDTSYAYTYQGDPPSRIIWRSKHLSLIADLSPLVTGHLLMVSNWHYYSFAEVISYHQREVTRFREFVQRQYSRTFGPPLVFEHGSTHDMEGSACITHAHWHFLPMAAAAVDQIMERDGFQSVRLGELAELGTSTFLGVPYFFRSADKDHVVYRRELPARRQYLRSVAVEILGIPDPEWDWATVIRKDLHRETMTLVQTWRLNDQARLWAT